jgi:hypothetical protein
MGLKLNPLTGEFELVGGGSSASSIVTTLFDGYTDAASSGTSVTNAYSFTVPAGQLAANGDKLFFNYAGISTATGSNGNVIVNFAGTNILAAYSVITASGVFSWVKQGVIIRVNSTTIRVNQGSTNSAGAFFNAYEEITGLDLTTAITMKLTLQALVAGTVTARLGTVYYQAAA